MEFSIQTPSGGRYTPCVKSGDDWKVRSFETKTEAWEAVGKLTDSLIEAGVINETEEIEVVFTPTH